MHICPSVDISFIIIDLYDKKAYAKLDLFALHLLGKGKKNKPSSTRTTAYKSQRGKLTRISKEKVTETVVSKATQKGKDDKAKMEKSKRQLTISKNFGLPPLPTMQLTITESKKRPLTVELI